MQNTQSSPSKSNLAPVPPPMKTIHRNPNFVAKQAAEQNGGVNPLMSRLYSSSVPGQQPGVPNILNQQSKKPTEAQQDATKAAAAASSGPGATTTVYHNSLQLFTQPVFRENDLKQMLLSTSHSKPAATAVMRRQTPPTRLLPLATVDGATQGAREATPPREGKQDEHPSPLHVVSRFRATAVNTPKEFTYLVMRPRGIRDVYNPYDLQVATHKDIAPTHYFTVSAAGVTKFDDGEAEFMELKAWEREHSIFHNLVQLDVFKRYKQWKTFQVWRKLVRTTTIQSYKSHLSDNLFHLHPSLSSALRVVRKICLDFLTQNNLYVVAQETRTLDGFCSTLNNHLNFQRNRLDRTVKEIRDEIEKACKSAMLLAQAAREKNVATNDTTDDRKKKRGGEYKELGAQQKASYIELSQKRAVCRRLTAFIRLCDYIVIHMLTNLAMKAIRDAHSDLQYPRVPKKKKEGEDKPEEKKDAHHAPKKDEKGKKKDEKQAFEGMIFSVDVLYSTEDEVIHVKPAVTSFTQRIDEIMKDYIKTVSAVPRFAQMETFKVYTEQGMSDSADDANMGPDVGEMVTSEEDYKNLMLGIRNSITKAFTVVDSYAHEFDGFRNMYLRNLRLNPDEIRKNNEPLDFFRDRLQQYKQQSEDIERKIPNNKDVALFAVHSDALREFFTPNPMNCLRTFHELLPVIAHLKNEAMLNDLQSCNKFLDVTPQTVEAYAEYMVYYGGLENRIESVNRDFEFLRELWLLLNEEKVHIAEEDDDTYRSGTRPQFEKLRNLMQRIEENKESQQRHFSRSIVEQMEELTAKIEEINTKAKNPIIEDDNAKYDDVIPVVMELQVEAEAVAAREKELRRFQISFGVDETPIDQLQDMVIDVNVKVRLWTSMRDWDVIAKQYSEVPFVELDPAQMTETINKYFATVKQVAGKLPLNLAVPMLKSKVEEWRLLAPLVGAMKNPKMKPEHITKISQTIGKVSDSEGNERFISEMEKTFTFGMLINNNIIAMKDEILIISVAATEEDKLQQMIDKVNAAWNGGGAKPPMEFIYQNHKDIKDLYVLAGGSVEDVNALLEDSLVSVSTIGSSRFCVGVLKVQVDRWEARLRYMQETLDRWIEFQRNWMYLENIFSSAEIRNQWKDDAKKFEGADKFFRDLMRKAHDSSNASRAVLINSPSFDQDVQSTAKTLKQDFESNNKELEKVLASLERKLEEKRRSFPRFYFLSNDDLLDILAKVKQPDLIMAHMLKMFDGIKSLSFSATNDILMLLSMEGEKVELSQKNIKARGQVEQWLGALEKEMFTTLRKLAKVCLDDYEHRNDRTTWIFQHPVQLVLIMSQMFWTKGVEVALDQPNSRELMKGVRESNYKQLSELAGLTARKLNKVQRIVLSTLITLDVHGRDLVDEMYDNEVTSTADFGWTKQLRIYWEQDDDGHGNAFIRQNNSRFVYGYEYLGAQGRLVITPLTDRVYMTITGALKLYLGAAPAGPAGTGKTETTKDLAKNLARQCIVYNCSDGVTYKMMEKFFSGLIQTGAWTCLDEFNRINIEVLSVIASQVLEIKLAMQSGADSFTFQGTPNVRIRQTYGAFITMNPGYAGRTELPDNLKILFRPVAVMTPDFRMIAEVILYSEGFNNAKDLSLKITQLYKLSSEQLSPQDHYDFGMRALKSILVMAGDLKRSQPDVEEDLTLIVACNDSNIPKFVAEDIPLFRGIMQDLFPGVSFPERIYHELLPAMEKDMLEKSLLGVDTWVKKGIQFYETLIVRHGVMLVGVTGTGKSESRNTIASALQTMHTRGSSDKMARPVLQFVLNPKSVLMHELYGILDVNTNEWKDGVLAVIAKNCVRESEGNNDHRWIVFDGPVDTLWIESMNSVLDDSKLLCLDSGERIKLPDTIHMIFEVADLSVASPATVSRCGMVFVDANDMVWDALLHQWSLTKLVQTSAQPQCREYIISVIKKFMQVGLDWLSKQSVLIGGGNMNVVQSLLDLYSAILTGQEVKLMADPVGETVLSPEDAIFRERNEMCNQLFVFCFVWSVGGNVDLNTQDAFDNFCREIFEGFVRLPNQGTMYDFFVDFNSRSFVTWESKVPEFKYNAAKPFFDILVPTVDTVRYSYIAKNLIRYQKPILFSGQTGVGKSVIMADCLNMNKTDLKLALIIFQFSAQTSSERTQELVESKLKQKRKNILGAPPDRSVVLFIDDLNMPALEVFGASPPIELLRQIMGNGGFYDRKVAGFWKYVQDVTVVAACGPPEGGRNPVTARLTRMFHLLQIPNLSDDSMKRIFVSILSGFFEYKNFSRDIKDLAKPMIAGAVEIFQRIREDLRPRPTTPHYTFNLRDLAKVCQGLMQVIPRVCKDSTAGTRLWIHEMMRCLSDRLVSYDDRRVFTENLMLDVLRRMFPGTHTHEDYFEKDPLIWGDFLRFGAAEKVYEEATDFKKVYRLFDEYLDDYNAMLAMNKDDVQSSSMNLVFFKDHCEHLARIVRIIRQPRGNALLVGVGGSGKRSLTRLAASIAEYKRFEIAVGKGYNMNDFHESLLELYTVAGIKGIPIVFLLSDNQIVNEGMLEDVNNMLNSGEVPSLFSPEERDKKINASIEGARGAGFTARDEVYNYFISKVRDNMHIVLCMSPVGDAFRTRCRQFPSLTNCCSIDWFNEWPDEALRGVAERLMSDVDFEKQPELRAPLTELCVDVHQAVVQVSNEFWDELRRRYYITPTSYLEFIKLFKLMLIEKGTDMTEQLSRVVNGKLKMKQTDETIAVMSKEIDEKKPMLEKASKETEAVVVDLKIRQEKAEVVQMQVRAQQESAAEMQKKASEIAADANSKLAEAKPIIDRAQAALDTIQSSDLNELRSFANPPAAVLKVSQACMTMFDPKDFGGSWSGNMDWKGAREFLSYRPLLDMIKNYPSDNVKPQVLLKIQKFINDEEFTIEICASKGSQTCGSLCAWVRAVNEFSKVIKEIAPKRAAAAEAEKMLAENNEKLNKAKATLKEVEDELAQLQSNYEASVTKKKNLEEGLKTCINRLQNAETLSACLKSEGVRWEENIKVFETKLLALPVDIFLSCACIAYFGAFTTRYRKRVVSMWLEKVRGKGIQVADFSLSATMGNPMEILSWQINFLPTDETSTENGIIVSLSNPPRRWPLMIDPQGQALKWLTQQYNKNTGPAGAKSNFKIIKLSESTYMRSLESAIRLGGTIILDDVGETLDPALEPLLMRQIFSAEGGGPMIQMSVQSGPIDYNNNFRFFMCTKLPNPHYLPDVSIKVTLVNFTVTMDGLEDQMLGEVVSIEKRELEEEKNEIIMNIADGQKKLKQIEETVLFKLKNSKGNILDDKDLINELKSAQSNATVLGRRNEEAREKMKIINITREMYRTVATRCAVLFFVLADLCRIDPMYQYSLEYFKRLVCTVVESTKKPAGFNDVEPTAEMLHTHLANLMECITEATYSAICRGLFNKDKTILSLLMCTSIARNAGHIIDQEWQYFVRASALVATEVQAKPANLDWINVQQWELCDTLNRTVPCFNGFINDLKNRSDLWKQFVLSSTPHECVYPGGGGTAEDEGKNWEEFLTPFQKILIIRCFREEKLLFALSGFVRVKLGKQYVEPPAFSLERAMNDSSPSTPIVFILSPGADPMNMLQAFAITNGKSLQYVSLGQGQGDNAKRLIETCRKTGDWAMLQNCHLSKTFMPELEIQVAQLQVPGAPTNPQFRLWLTSMPTDFFPVFVLQNSVKLTNEPPTGLKANMIRCFNEITESDFEVFKPSDVFPECSKEHAYKKLIYGLCFFHSVVLERKKFGPLGWNTKYEWNDTDFHVSKQWLRLFLEEQALIPYESLEYIIGQINYGGRVTDPNDRGTLMTILKIYLNRNLLLDGYSFSGSGRYKAPPAGPLQSFRDILGQMSIIDDPEVFGMHENANLRFQLQVSELIMGTVLSIQPRLTGSKGGGPSPEEQVMQKCKDFEATLPDKMTKEEAGPTSFTSLANGLPNSLSTVLSHEMVKYNKLLSRMRFSLGELQKALQGLTVLSEDLDKMYTSFLNDQVPSLWSSVGYASLKPLGAWYREFINKIQFIRTWVQKGEPMSFWITGFFNPSAFMTGALQAFARAEGVSVDKLGFSFAIVDIEGEDVTEQPHRGCYIHGIFTDAWRWDRERKTMTDSLPGEPYSILPVVHFLPEPYHKTPSNFHRVPMYRTTIRAGVISSLGASSNFVCPIEAPTEKESDYWVLKGAACVCALNF